MNHTLLTIDEYARIVRPLHLVEMRLVEANVTAGNAVRICRCGTFILKCEYSQIQDAHVSHLHDVVKERRA